MKTITIERNELIGLLTDTSAIIQPKTPIAIMAYGCVAVKGDRIRVKASTPDVTIRKFGHVIAASEEDMEFVTDIKKMAAYLSKISDNDVTLTIADEAVTLQHSKGKSRFICLDAKEFPDSEEKSGEWTEVKLPCNVFGEWLSVGQNFVSTETIRPQLASIYFYLEDGELGVCATDTHALYHDKIAFGEDAPKLKFHVLPSVCPTLSKRCSANEFVSVGVTEKHVRFRFPDLIVQTTMPVGTFPNFKRVIPQDNHLHSYFNKKDVMDAAARILISVPEAMVMKFTIHENEVSMISEDLTRGDCASEKVPTRTQGNGELTIGFNPKTFMKCLKYSGDKPDVSFRNESAPASFRQEDRPDKVIICMPMSLMNND